MGKHACHHVADIHGGSRFLKERQAHEEERETEDEFTDTLSAALSTEDQRHADGQHRDGESRNVHLETHGRNNPRRNRSTDVGTHDDTDRLRQRHQSGIHETHYHHRRGTR